MLASAPPQGVVASTAGSHADGLILAVAAVGTESRLVQHLLPHPLHLGHLLHEGFDLPNERAGDTGGDRLGLGFEDGVVAGMGTRG
jgi:hypothetical protein